MLTHKKIWSSEMLSRVSNYGIRYYCGRELSIEETEKCLCQFKGGNVILNKNDETGIATICLQRPEKKNAISGQMLIQLMKIAEDLENWKNGKGFILYGSNNNFSSGGDLSMSRNTTSEEQGHAIAKYVQILTSKLKNLPLLSVAFIQGVALGGGAELSVASCDWRIIAKDAKIGFVHGKMGITPGWGGATALKNLVGPSIALDLITSGRLISAMESMQIKLTNFITESEIKEAENWLLERTKISAEVLKSCKLLVNNTNDNNEDELQHERNLHAPLWGGQSKIDSLNKNIKHK